MKHTVRYIKKTVDLGIYLRGDIRIDDLGLYYYTDTAFTDCILTQYSTRGYIVFLTGGLVF